RLKSILRGDVAPAVTGGLFDDHEVAVAPHKHRGDNDFAKPTAHIRQRDPAIPVKGGGEISRLGHTPNIALSGIGWLASRPRYFCQPDRLTVSSQQDSLGNDGKVIE